MGVLSLPTRLLLIAFFFLTYFQFVHVCSAAGGRARSANQQPWLFTKFTTPLVIAPCLRRRYILTFEVGSSLAVGIWTRVQAAPAAAALRLCGSAFGCRLDFAQVVNCNSRDWAFFMWLFCLLPGRNNDDGSRSRSLADETESSVAK